MSSDDAGRAMSAPDGGFGGEGAQPQPAPPSPAPKSHFGLALTGTILGALALALGLVLAIPVLAFMLSSGFGWFAYEMPGEELVADTEPPDFEAERAMWRGTLDAPGPDGYTAQQVSSAVEAVVDRAYLDVDVHCPAIDAATAGDLLGRVLACDADDQGFPMDVTVYFTDRDGSFTVRAF